MAALSRPRGAAVAANVLARRSAPLRGAARGASRAARRGAPRACEAPASERGAAAAPAEPAPAAPEAEAAPNRFRFEAAASMVPHPAKVAKGGEDALFIGPCGTAIGVADGVGGWAEDGVDPAEYANAFVVGMAKAAAESSAAAEALSGGAEARGILDTAHGASMAVPGAATAVVALVRGRELHVANLGDSGLRLIRGGQVVAATKQQQHYWDCPFQFGSASSDLASDAEVLSLPLEVGDVVILASDGVYDNVFDGELEQIAAGALGDDKERARAIADGVTALARRHSEDTERDSPYSLGAIQSGIEPSWFDKLLGKRIVGGKLDDTTACVAVIAEAEVEPVAEEA